MPNSFLQSRLHDLDKQKQGFMDYKHSTRDSNDLDTDQQGKW